MANDYLRSPDPHDPRDHGEPWLRGPTPGARRRRRVLVPALTVAVVAVGAGVLYVASSADAPVTRRPGTSGTWLDKDRPPPGPALNRPGGGDRRPAAPATPDAPSGDAAEPDRRPGTGGRDRAPGARPRSGNAPAQSGSSPAVRPRRPAKPDGTGNGPGRRHPRTDRPRSRKPPFPVPVPGWVDGECRRRYPHDATRRSVCINFLQGRGGR
ncbi:hypothetical protein [Actinomadura algeriensis]|uniref:Uncharacterized protein n=1 Tax=Actinomadura algeriensis TaxID=1679523 RepID=A0ABR9K0L5_9ACTN|nr:hypothetical protein [Actinomadura algeriensis]MBE1536362.1 hypothetical protein [Actinomadura algeriensis]